jgi:hypothetical protein
MKKGVPTLRNVLVALGNKITFPGEKSVFDSSTEERFEVLMTVKM